MPVFDLRNHEDRERVSRHLELLRTRTIDDLKVLHYLKTPEGVWCLDFNLFSSDQEELDRLVVKAIENLGPVDVLPAADLKLWMRMVESKLIDQRGFQRTPGTRDRLVLALCSEE